jgi:hypothetical protein
LDGPFDDISIRPQDIDVSKLLDRLANPKDKLAEVLILDAATVLSYRQQVPVNMARVANELAAALSAALKRPGLSDRIDTGRVSPKTLEDASKYSSGKSLQRANQALLREAYPDEIVGLAQAFYNHALIKSLSKQGSHPSYVPGRTFAVAITDILGASRTTVNPLDTVKSSIDALPDSDVKRALLTLVQNAGNDLATFQRNLETWFEDAMDRVSGWYKQKSQIVTVVVAAGLTIFANADSVQLARKLFLNPVLREKIVKEASAVKTQPDVLTTQERADLGELTGWSAEFRSFHRIQAEQAGKSPADVDTAGNNDAFPGADLLRDQHAFWPWMWAVLPVHLLGWILTAVAVSLGAPFWFDTLNKFMNIRAAGTAPNEKGQDKSKV